MRGIFALFVKSGQQQCRQSTSFLGASGEHGGFGVRVGGDDDLDLGGTSRLNFGTGFAIFSNIFALSPTMLY